MSAQAMVLWPLLKRLQARAQVLEAEAMALRMEVERVTQTLDYPVATYTIDGEDIILTVADIEAVRAQLVKPRSEETIRDLALAQKLSKRSQSLSDADREHRFWENVVAIRTEYDPHILSLGASCEGVRILDGLHFLYWVRGDTAPVS